MSVLKIHLNKTFGKSSPVTRILRNYGNLDTVDVAYTEYGKDSVSSNQSSTLIVMHCLFGSKRTWHTVCKTLHEKTSPQLRVIAVDARNHGDSPHANNHSYPHLSEDIMAFTKQQGIRKTSLLGHSMGGRTAMYFALKYPDSIDKLIVGDISPIARPEKMESLREMVEAIKRVSLPQDMSLSKAREFVNTQLAEKISSKSEREFLLTNLTKNVDKSFKWLINAVSLAANMNHIIGFPDVSNLKFDGRVLFLVGEKSDFVEKGDYPLILKLFPKAEFYEIPRAGHWLYKDNPEDFTQKCISFLNIG